MASAKRLQQEAYKAWLVGLMFNAVAGAYTLWQLRQREQNIDRKNGEGVVESKKLVKYGPSLNFYLASVDRLLQGTQRYESSAHL